MLSSHFYLLTSREFPPLSSLQCFQIWDHIWNILWIYVCTLLQLAVFVTSVVVSCHNMFVSHIHSTMSRAFLIVTEVFYSLVYHTQRRAFIVSSPHPFLLYNFGPWDEAGVFNPHRYSLCCNHTFYRRWLQPWRVGFRNTGKKDINITSDIILVVGPFRLLSQLAPPPTQYTFNTSSLRKCSF